MSAQEIVNCVTTADDCVHTDDTTKLSPTSCEFVFTPPTPTRQNNFVASASAVCIGHKGSRFAPRANGMGLGREERTREGQRGQRRKEKGRDEKMEGRKGEGLRKKGGRNSTLVVEG